MLKRIVSLLALFLLIGCKKDEPPSPPKVANEPAQPKQEEPKQDDKKTDPAKSEKESRVKLFPLDLRAYGIYAVIDAPRGVHVVRNEKDGQLTIEGDDGYALTLLSGAADLARHFADLKASEGARFKSTPINDESALVAEIEENGKRQYVMLVNVGVAGKPYTIAGHYTDATLSQVQRNVQAARSLRQTPEMKAGQEKHAAALKTLGRVPDGLTMLKTGGIRVRINGSTPGYEDDFNAVLTLPELTELELINTDKYTDEHIRTLASLPRFRALTLYGKWVTRRVLSALPALERLERLDIEGAPTDDNSLGPVARLSRLKHLSLRDTRVGDSAAKILSELKELEYLDLQNTNVTSAGLTPFKSYPKLRVLVLNETAVSDANLADLAAAPALQQIQFAMTSVSDRGLEAFAGTTRPLALELYGTDATLDGIARLKKANGKISINTSWLEEPEPKAVMPPVAINMLPPTDPTALVTKQGGKFTRDEDAVDKPIVAIDLTNCKITDVDLGSLRTATRLEKLNLAGCTEITDAGLPYLAGLTTLEEVDLRGTKVKGDGLVRLKGLTRLTRLYLPENAQFTARQLAPVAALPGLEILSFKLPKQDGILVFRMLSKIPRLKEVNFTDVALTNRHLDFVKNLKNLETLVLSRSERLSDRGLTNLKGLENLKTLTIPAFSGTNFGLENLRGLQNLKIFELYGANITDAGMPAVGALHNLERLRLDRLNIGDDGVRSLRHFNEERFVEMSLGGTRVTDKGLDAIADNKKIEFIDLSHTKVTDAGLAKFKDLEELRGLRLDGTTITGKGFEALAGLPRLYRVSLQDAKVDDAGAAALARVSRLQFVKLSGNLITSDALRSFQNLRQLEDLDLDRCTKLTDAAAGILKAYPALKRVSLKGTALSAKAIEDLRQSGVKVEFGPKP